MKQAILLFLFAGMLYDVHAQLPKTKIVLFDLQRSAKGYQLQAPKIISKGKGYNNQPWFTADGENLFFVSSIDTSNTEIYKYRLAKKKLQRITKTKEAEYSARHSPDMENISCVRVEKDKVTQHIVQYTSKGKKPSILLPRLKNVGYYEWLNQQEVIVFELPEPFYLVRRSLYASMADTLAKNIGRTFYYLRGKGKIIYIDKSDTSSWKIKSISQDQLKRVRKGLAVESDIVCETLPGEEDFCFLQDGSILMGHNGFLYLKKNPFKYKDAPWDEFADLQTFGLQKFSRLAISPDNTKLAIVSLEGN